MNDSQNASDTARPRHREILTRRWPALTAWAVGLVSLALPLGWSGLWAPHEQDFADLARRIASNLHGADLTLAGADNRVPILADLGKGQLPFSSVALGFQAFGLSDWAGRLPLALWGGLGLVATYFLVSRFADRASGAYAVLILATTPLYYLHSRTLLGDGVTLASTAIATAGLCLGLLGTDREPLGRRLAWLGVALLGLLAGFASRGVWIGVACPTLGVGLGWLSSRLAARREPFAFADWGGLSSLALGLGALSLGAWVFWAGSPDAFLEVMGSELAPPRKSPTHDGVLHQLGFGLFPWSAVAPFALALALRPRAKADEPSTRLCTCLFAVASVGFALHGLSNARQPAMPFAPTFALAGLVAVAFRRAESESVRPRLMAIGTAALLILAYWDLRSQPDQALTAFSVTGAEFPESFTESAKRWIKYGCLGTLAMVTLTLGGLPKAPTSTFGPDGEGRRWLSLLRRGLGGWLPWVLGATTLLLAIPAVALSLDGVGHGPGFVRLLDGFRWPARVAFAVIPLAVLTPLVAWIARDLAVSLLSRIPVPRARLALASLAAFGLAMSLGYYPALASHLSPRNVFQAFRARAGPGEPLAVVGHAGQVAPYYTQAEVHAPKSARAGFEWLVDAPSQRRWLVLDAAHLGQLNHLYRKRSSPAENLPILDAISSEVLLASNRLAPGEANQNPLSPWLSSSPPEPQHPLDVDLEGKLRCLGWGVTHADGSEVSEVRVGEPYQFRIYWEVTDHISGNWKTFIHIDAAGRRFNGDHDTLDGKYPFRYWQKGDYVTDVTPMQLERHFANATYQVYFGLFSGNTRLKVTRGAHHENRIEGGALVVR